MRRAPHPFTLRQLQYIVAVADRKSFREAAAECHVAQPSLSAQVAQVEAMLSLQLFERDKHGVALTAAGRAFVERARALTLAADDLVDYSQSLSDPFSATLRIGVIPTVGPYLLPDIAPALCSEYPKLQFVWIEDKTATLVDKLAQSELDAAILALEADIGDLPHVVLGRDPFVFAAALGHPLAAAKGPLRPEQLDGERVLLLDDGHCFRDQALSLCTSTGAREVSDYRATSLSTLVQMTASGAGVTLLPALSVEIENRRHTLHLRSFTPKAPGRTVVLAWRKNSALLQAIEAVAKTMQGAYAQCTRKKRSASAVKAEL